MSTRFVIKNERKQNTMTMLNQIFLTANETVAVGAEGDWLDMFLSSWWFFVILLLPLFAMFKVKATFAKWNKVRTQGGVTAVQIARELLDANGLHDVVIVRHPGNLSDHYDPRSRTVALSESVHDKDTVGAIAVAAHEVGHAIQHGTAYSPLKARSALVPIVNMGSKIWIFLIIASIFLEIAGLLWVGVGVMAFSVLFHLVTLPVELDASRRAMNALSTQGYLVGKEIGGARSTLSAAAFTYLAALIASVIQLLRLLALARRR
jgi:hypothetical protein